MPETIGTKAAVMMELTGCDGHGVGDLSYSLHSDPFSNPTRKSSLVGLNAAISEGWPNAGSIDGAFNFSITSASRFGVVEELVAFGLCVQKFCETRLLQPDKL